MNREPSAILSALGIFLASLSKAAVLLGLVDWDADQLAVVGLVIDSAIIFLGALFIRANVTPIAAPALQKGTEVTQLDAQNNPTGETSTV